MYTGNVHTFAFCINIILHTVFVQDFVNVN